MLAAVAESARRRCHIWSHVSLETKAGLAAVCVNRF
jgi:hypothetical protein